MRTQNQPETKRISAVHKGKGDYYAVSSSGYTKLQNVNVDSPTPLVILQPFSKCHYLLPMNNHEKDDDKSDIKSVQIQDGKSTFFSSNQCSSIPSGAEMKIYESKQLISSSQVSEREDRRTALKKMSVSNFVRSDILSPKKGILKRSYHQFNQYNSRTIKKQSVQQELQRQREKSRKLEQDYKKLFKLANDRGLESQEIEDEEKDYYQKPSKFNEKISMITNIPIRQEKQSKKVQLKNLSFHQNTEDCEQEEEYDDITDIPKVNRGSLRNSRMNVKAKQHHKKILNRHECDSLESFDCNNYSKTMTKCPTVISSRQGDYEYDDKVSAELQIIMRKLNKLQYDLERKDQEAQRERQQREIKERERQIHALQIQNARIKQLNQMMLLKETQNQEKKKEAEAKAHENARNPLERLNGNALSVLLMTIMMVLFTSKNIICN